MHSIEAFDHTLILVEDLDDADARMRRLGFRPTPRGFHSAHMGTANSTIMLSNMTYFEVIGVVNPTPSNADMRKMLEQRQGLLGFAMKSADARACADELAALSAGDGQVVDFARPVDFADGPRDAAFSVAHFDPESTLGLMMFACSHHTPDVVWRTDYLQQPNGVTGVSDLVGEVVDLDAAEHAFRTLFAERVDRRGEAVLVDFGNVRVAFLSGAELKKSFGLAPFGEPALRVLALTTATADAAKSILEENGVETVDLGDGYLTVPPDQACGTMIQFATP